MRFYGYVVSAGGTFGIPEREYKTEDGTEMLLICWGPLRWLTPVRADEVKQLRSNYEAEAELEARAWLAARAEA